MLMCKSILFTDLRFSFNGFKYAKPVEIKMCITQDFLNAVDECLQEELKCLCKYSIKQVFSGGWFLFVSVN